MQITKTFQVRRDRQLSILFYTCKDWFKWQKYPTYSGWFVMLRFLRLGINFYWEYGRRY